MPNLFFIIAIPLLTLIVTFVSVKGTLSDLKFKRRFWKAITKRGWWVIIINCILIGLLIWQNQNSISIINLEKTKSDSITAQKDRANKEISDKLLAAQENFIELQKKLNDTTTKVLTNSQTLILAQQKINNLQESLYLSTNELNKKTDKVIDDNVITGELEMNFDIGSKVNQKPILILGGEFDADGPLPISLGGFMPITTRYVDNKLLVSMKVYDLNGNLIAELEDNKWRPNKNFSGKFNYDKKGFEVINNQGGIAASFDIIKPNTIKIQGFFPYKEANRILLLGDTGFTAPPFGTKEIEEMVFRKTKKIYSEYLKEKIASVPTKQLFEYTGSNWKHKRKQR